MILEGRKYRNKILGPRRLADLVQTFFSPQFSDIKRKEDGSLIQYVFTEHPLHAGCVLSSRELAASLRLKGVGLKGAQIINKLFLKCNIYVLKKKQRDKRQNGKLYVVSEALLVLQVIPEEIIFKGYTTKSRQCGDELGLAYF